MRLKISTPKKTLINWTIAQAAKTITSPTRAAVIWFLAVSVLALSPPEGFTGQGPLGLEGGEDPGSVFNNFISSAIGLITVVAIIWFVFLFIIGAIGFMTAGGDKAALETARKKLTNGVVGFIIVIAAIFIIQVISEILGLEGFLNPAQLIENIAL